MQTLFQESEPRFCPICGPAVPKKLKYPPSKRDNQLFDASVFNSRDGFHDNYFSFVECVKCGIIFTDPAPTAKFASRLYEISTVEYNPLEPWIYKAYVSLLQRASKFTPDLDSFVEIGGDAGFLLRHAAEKGFREQIEIEPSKDAQKKFIPPSPSARFVCDIFRGNEAEKNSVSEIVFLHTLDHISDPYAFLQNALALLKPGGVAVCAVHNTRAWSAKILGKRSPIFTIGHTYLFHTTNIRILFEKVGFDVLDVFPYANTYPLWYWMRDIDLLRSMKTPLLKVLEKIGISNIPIKLFAGNMTIIAKKPIIGRRG